MSANVAATQPPANANGQHGEGWRNRGRDRYRPHKHKGGQKSHPDILIPTKLASIILSLSLKELAPEENMLMGIDSLSARIQEEYMAILKEGGVELLNACQQDDNSSVYSRSLSPVKKETAGKVGLSGPGDDEGYPQSSLPTPAPEVDSPLVPNALDANTKPTISKKFEPTDLLDNVYLRRVIASCILPVALASADGKVEYYELDVVEDRKRRNYPWLAQAVKATDSAMKAIDTLPDFVKLAIPKVITPQMLKSHKLEGSLDEMVAELNKALEERRTEVKSRRAAAEAKFQQSRKLANLERLRVHDQDPPPPLFLSQAFISVVTQSASTLLKILEQPPGFLQTRYEFLKKLQNIINRSYHGAGVKAHLFGSSVTGLGNIGSDVDVTLEVPGTGNPQDHPISNMYNLGKILRAAGMVKVTVIAHARVPICKFVDPFLKLSCDVNVGNMLGIQNSKLISTYLSLDPRVHPLIMLIKHWAKAREINNPSGGGTLSSYAYALMVINFLQIRGFLPSLQELYSAPERKWLTTRVQERPRIKNRKFNHYRFKDNDKARKTKNSENSQDLETAGETAAASSKEKEIEAESAFIETVQGMVTWDISYVDNLDHPDLKEYPRITADGLGPTVIMLFYGFMHYYGWDYEYRPDRVVSVRKGTVLDYVPTPLKRDKVLDAALIVEDPFQV
ncbi:hypothetical protein BC829DRAFT_33624 [Chytridium lagenaria]|nr:hypothetical protein BC829DRAFT_33624 [Chytridium lagenaria]